MEKYTELKNGSGLTLRGTIHIPDSGGLHPFVVMYHGFTGNRLEAQGNFTDMSAELETAGIGSIRFDFSGSGGSDGDFADMTLTGEIEEARLIHSFILASGFADKNRIILLGMSMGGLIAGIIAHELPGLKSLVLWAPAGNMGEIIRNLNEAHPGPDELVGYNGTFYKKSLLNDILQYEPYREAKKFAGNVLIVHGTRDGAVPLSVSKKYQKSFPGKCSLVEVPGADHIFSRVTWKDKLIEATKKFILTEIG